MHYRMLVTTSLQDGATSEDARCTVHDALVNDDSFCGTGGRFGHPLSDWFVIGGRWSGLLAETVIGETYRAAIIARFPEMAKEWWPHSLVCAHRAELDDIWQAHGGTGPSPYTRNGDDGLGHPDDAMLVTHDLYDALLAPYEGESLVTDGSHCEYVDLDDDPLGSTAIGRKWLVLVDYHN
jgi:hypothetical protein